MSYWFKPNGHWNRTTKEAYEVLKRAGYEWDMLQYRHNDEESQ